ncbi:MAG: hypothetical protein K6F15_05000 [Treponema sp.]|nr:hypothetical protein [Treponema sp.]
MVTFETKCYENDWAYILKGNYLKKLINRSGGKNFFEKKQLIINNVKNRDLVTEFAQKKVDEGVIDAFYFAEDYADEVLNFFDLTAEDLGKGYVYSISELTGLYLCKSDFLLHFASDAFVTKKSARSKWIQKSIELMKANSDYICSTLVWNSLYREAKADNLLTKEEKYFWGDHGFSDQCYLVNCSVFRTKIYNERNTVADSLFPVYGGDLFEKRCSAYLRNFNLYRLVYKNASYIHANFPKVNTLSRKIYDFAHLKLGLEFTTMGRSPNFFERIIRIIKQQFFAKTVHLCKNVIPFCKRVIKKILGINR